jgi:hypothetical protein
MYSYKHNGNSAAMIGIGVYRGGTYGLEYEGSYFYADFTKGSLM